MQGQIVGKVGFPGTNVKEITEKFVLTPEQIRTLNSVPVDLVVPANAATFLAPGECVLVAAQGSGAYSGPVSFALQYAGGSPSISLDASTNWDGTTTLSTITQINQHNGFGSGAGIVIDPLLGLSLQITSGGDVTGGDAPCTIILTYRAYDLTGLL